MLRESIFRSIVNRNDHRGNSTSNHLAGLLETALEEPPFNEEEIHEEPDFSHLLEDASSQPGRDGPVIVIEEAKSEYSR